MNADNPRGRRARLDVRRAHILATSSQGKEEAAEEIRLLTIEAECNQKVGMAQRLGDMAEASRGLSSKRTRRSNQLKEEKKSVWRRRAKCIATAIAAPAEGQNGRTSRRLRTSYPQENPRTRKFHKEGPEVTTPRPRYTTPQPRSPCQRTYRPASSRPLRSLRPFSPPER